MSTQPRSNTRTVLLSYSPILAGCCTLIAINGCKREEIHSYRVQRQTETAPAPTTPSTQQTPAQQQVTWSVPDAWHEVETTVDMRVATFQSDAGTTITVTAFPGDVGGQLANVNRWRAQVGLEPTDEQGAASNIEAIEGANAVVVDIAGTKEQLLGSIINVGDGMTWFVKAKGDPDAIAQIKSNLIEFSASFHIHQHDLASTPQTQSAPDTASKPSPNTSSPWVKPTQWSVDPDASSIVKLAYFSESGARITLTELSGQGGGLLSNINRWRGQVGLQPVQSMDDQPKKDLPNDGLIVDLQAPSGSARIMAAVVAVGDRTLFFKLTGTMDQTKSEVERFGSFIVSQSDARQNTP